MTKPSNLPPKTNKDWDYLVSRGWRHIGTKRDKYGPHYYWDYFIGSDGGCWSSQYIMGDALTRQQQADKIVKTSKT